MKRIGFLSFGHWQDVSGSFVRTGGDALTQTIELAIAAEEIGINGAYLRVHHFARQLASPFPLLAAMAARTSRIELGTGVIDMRYENPLAMAEQAAIADLISAASGAGGRLQLGLSRGSPETALRGFEAFGYGLADNHGEVMDAAARAGNTPGRDDPAADMARRHTDRFREAITGVGIAPANPAVTGTTGRLPIQPQSPGLSDRIWWGSGTRASAKWAGEQGMHLMSSTLLTEDTGVPFDELQAEQIDIFRAAWASAGHPGTPRVSVSRSIIPIVTDLDHHYFGLRAQVEGHDQVGRIDGTLARFGKSYIGEPDQLAEQLAADAAVQSADTLLITIPNQLGVDYNAQLLESVAKFVAPALGWQPAGLVKA